MNDLADYRRDMGPRQPLDPELERRLISAAQAGDRDATDRLFRAHAYYVVNIASKFARSRVPLPDLVQAGNVGLLRGILHFDTTRANNLVTYVTHWIHHEIRILMRNSEYTIHRPSQWFLKSSKDKMQATLAEWQLKALDGGVGPLGPKADQFRAADADDEMDREEAQEWLGLHVAQLDDDLREVVEGRLRGETLRDIGARLGVSRQTVKNRESMAIERLREMTVAV